MKYCKLKKNEAVLFKGTGTLSEDYKRKTEDSINCDVLLTNLNIIVLYEKKGLFGISTKVLKYKTDNVKIYDDTVQILREAKAVDVYLRKTELHLEFNDEKVAKDFCNKAITLISGDSKVVRFLKKAQKTIDKTSETVNDGIKVAGAVIDAVVDTVDSVKEITSSKENDKPRLNG